MGELKKLISIVSPAFNEEENIPLMIAEVKKVFKKLGEGYDFEYIFVNDGSKDSTWKVINDESVKDNRVKGISLSRNFGHQLAISAGLDMAKGDAVIYCDADLQQPPEIFDQLISKWENGFEIVHTKRLSTENVSFIKNFFSNFFYSVINYFSDVKVEKGMADFKLLDKKVHSHLIKFREVNRFLRGIIPWLGFKSTIVEYSAKKREHGRPGFSFGKSMSLAKTGILAFSIKPLKMVGYFGFALTVFSALFITFSVIYFLVNRSWYFSPLVNLVMFNAFLIGLVLICLGIMSLYISYVYNEVVDRPLYIVSDSVNV